MIQLYHGVDVNLIRFTHSRLLRDPTESKEARMTILIRYLKEKQDEEKKELDKLDSAVTLP